MLNNKYKHNKIIYPLVISMYWPLYKLYDVIFKDGIRYSILPLMLPTFFYILAAVLFYILANKLKSIKRIYIFLVPLILVFIDILLKLLVKKYNLEISFGYLFQIKPNYNLYNAALLNFLDIDCPFIIVLIIRLSILFIFPLILKKMYDELKADYFYIQIAFILLISGGLCSILDMIIFGYTLDYIYLQYYFTMDLKDIYVDLGIHIIIAYIINIIIQQQRVKKERAKKNVNLVD